MGKFRNNLVAAVSNAVVARKTSKKQLTMSILSLILASLILGSATFCWYALGRGSGTANNVSLIVGNGLRVNDLGDATKKFNDASFLQPASSVDGRNLFFPTDGLDFSKETKRMTFRSANAGDRNYNYVQLDFNLTAEANYTGIYLDKSTSLKIEVPEHASAAYKEAAAKAEKALRTAIYYEGMDEPVIFTSQMNPCSVNAVKDIDRTTGHFIESANQVARPFKDYSYGKRQLAMLNQGETRPFSLIIWLEGTDDNCTSMNVMLKQLILDLKFTTSWDNTVEINFKDSTQGNSLSSILDNNRAYSLVLDYNSTVHKIDHLKFTMQKKEGENNTWKCNIPDNAVNDLSFQILDGSGTNVLYEWKYNKNGGSTYNRGTATLYTADQINQSPSSDSGAFNNTKSYGHWYDGEIETHGEGHDEGIVDGDDW